MSVLTSVLGGVGIFLLGMMLMTDSLKALAGERLKDLLKRFTGGKVSSILSGTFVTSLIQSSSATSLMTIGFVSAGLITFSQAVGLILGANLGSTTTGWIISMLGIKFKIISIALPFIGIGAFLRFSREENRRLLGNVLAGFGLVFVGIDVLQAGMSEMSSLFNLQGYGEGFFGKLLLLFIGILMAVVMQSSSAAVALTITALYAQTISFDQAAVLVIGQNIGTTGTAFLGSIGGTVGAKRTALAHALFNVTIGVLVFITLPLFLKLVFQIGAWTDITEESSLLAIFHTTFNLIGVAAMFPFIHRFAKAVERLIPEKESKLTKHLDSNLMQYPALAIESAMETVKLITIELTKLLKDMLKGEKINKATLEEIEHALDQLKVFFDQIKRISNEEDVESYHFIIHSTDHLRRLIFILKERFVETEVTESTSEIISLLQVMVDKTLEMNNTEGKESLLKEIEGNSKKIADIRKEEREEIINKIALNTLTSESGMKQIEALLYYDGIAYHLWRIGVHTD